MNYQGLVETKMISGNSLIKTGPGKLLTMSISYTSGAATTFTLYDNTAASGTKLFEMQLAADAGTRAVSIPVNLSFETGLYCVPGANAIRANFSYI